MDSLCNHHGQKITLQQFIQSVEPVAGRRRCPLCGKPVRVSLPFALLHTVASLLWGAAIFCAIPRIVYFHFSPAGALLAVLVFAAATALWMLAGMLTVNRARYVECREK